MDIAQFISNFKTHPILFVGSGMSRRYLKNSPDWHGLLMQIAIDIWGSDQKFIDLADKLELDYPKIAGEFESLFKEEVKNNPKFSRIKTINEEYIRNRFLISPFKVYLSEVFSKLDYREELKKEIEVFKSLKNHIKSIVTTNYDGMLEDMFDFQKLIGNDILLSKQYGMIYKIHGCYTKPEKIIFTENDYGSYKEQNKLIISQLISLFIHSPVIFLGYGNNDENINFVLETIYMYVGNNQDLRDEIKNNFLVVEYAPDPPLSNNTEVSDSGNTLEGGIHLSFKKIRTNNYIAIYEAIKKQPYAIESGILRLVDDLMQRVFIDSTNQEDAQVINYFANDIKDKSLDNVNILGAIRNTKHDYIIKDKPVNVSQDYFIENYFKILDNKNIETIKLINSLKPKIAKKSHFPIFGFNTIISKSEIQLNRVNDIKNIQEKILDSFRQKCKPITKTYHSIESILEDKDISSSSKEGCIFLNIWMENINIISLENYLRNHNGDKKNTEYRRLITLYDYMKYSTSNIESELDDEDER